MLAALPLPAGLGLSFVAGLVAGAFVNWAAYSLAWNRRPISPWAARHPQARSRTAADRIPVVGWLGLRREHPLHGAGFWVRPLAVELLMGASWAALYWWEVQQQSLVAAQFEAIVGSSLIAPTWTMMATFLAHAVLITLMAAASLIDIDEKTIPDEITTPGVIIALILAAAAPMSLLPHVALRTAAPAAGAAIALPPGVEGDGFQLYVEPLTLTAPGDWPADLSGAPYWPGLAIGLACYALWLFALTPRLWRGRRGVRFGLRVLLGRIGRELTRPPLSWLGILGAPAIVAVWYRGGAPWAGLLTALVGMIGGSAMVWAVRIVGKWALRKEAMGFGDVTLMMMIGAFLGWQPCIFIFFIAPFAGLLVGILQMVLRRDDVIPYGPFLCLGALVVMIRWADLWNADLRSLQAFFDVPWLVPAILSVGVLMLGAMLVLWRNVKEAILGREVGNPHA
jgi:prepilin signal peptidase PulO-like enzyme (type II secretory pathway)